jgi:hypothetical protein
LSGSGLEVLEGETGQGERRASRERAVTRHRKEPENAGSAGIDGGLFASKRRTVQAAADGR